MIHIDFGTKEVKDEVGHQNGWKKRRKAGERTGRTHLNFGGTLSVRIRILDFRVQGGEGKGRNQQRGRIGVGGC